MRSPVSTCQPSAGLRPVRLPSIVAWVVLLWSVLYGQQALADDPDDEPRDSDDSTDLQQPKLENFVEAEYPETALRADVAGTVVLILTIDENGAVTEVEVERGPGHGLNRAAREAARDFRFEPAKRAGEPVASRIRYRYQFELPESDRPPPERNRPSNAERRDENQPGDDEPPDSDAPDDRADRGRLRGTVRDSSGERPASDARIEIVGPDGRTRTLDAGDDGSFRTERLPPGRYRIVATTAGGARAELRTEILAGETTDVSVRLRPPDDRRALEVTVHGQSKSDSLERSARAVDSVDTERAAEKAGDMGDVVAAEKGVNVRRTGGLGSGARISLNGLDDNQIRFFLDGIPLEYAGFPFGIANVPVNLVDRVDIYKGVVPVRYGADALGGAIDLVPEQTPTERSLAASYQVGSFDTHRLTLHGEAAGPDSKWYSRANGFFDYSKNDYTVDVEVADRTGQLYDVTARRFHDEYRAAGAALEVGTVDRSWADALSARVFVSDFARDLQHNLVMTVPYGEARYGETVAGGILRYEQSVASSLRLDFAAGYNFSRTWFTDLSACNYDWFGRCTSKRGRAGEVGKFATDQRIWEHAGFGRLNATWNVAPDRKLRLSVAPTHVFRTGDERADTPRAERDTLEAERNLFDLVTGLEYESNFLEGRLQNIGFFKDYLQVSRSDETIPSGKNVSHDRTTHRIGLGDSVRYSFTDAFLGKLSYEWATRLPSAVEMFGNGVLIHPNPELRPERSHNANLEFAVDGLQSPVGTWRGNLTGFLRSTDDLIVLIGGQKSFSYQNILDARGVGLEAAAGWTSPTDLVAVDLNATYIDLRNVSRSGAYEEFYGDRIPNRPYLYANGTLRLRERNLLVEGDSLTAEWVSRYVHDYYRGWASLGRTEFKQQIPAQWRQSVALTYGVENSGRSLSLTLQIQNLTDAKIFDYYGVQKPGRAVYFKSTIEL